MRISVAIKLVIFFGLAITAVVAAALAVPWFWMESLADELAVQSARKAAVVAAARCDLPAAGDWQEKQEQLNKWWEQFAREIEALPTEPPRLVRIDPFSKELPANLDEFLRSAIDRMRSNPHPQSKQINEWSQVLKGKDGRRRYRYAMAVRSLGGEIPKGALLGVIEATVEPAISQEQLWWNRAVILTAGGMSLTVALLLFTVLMQKLILKPVSQLKQVAEQVTAGDLSLRSQIRTRDEFQRLAEAFNNMLESLQRSQEELRKINRSLDVKLVELAELNVALHEANKLKSQFLASVSHELRTPLTSIIGFAELLTQSPSGQDGRIQRYAQNILTSGRMLMDLINDLLDLAKIEAGKMAMHIQEFSLRDVCEGLDDFIKPLADKANLQLELDLDANLPVMRSDPGKIKQILYNLLSNAVKFTPAGGKVVLAARPKGRDHVEISVSDTGPGIPKDQLPLIFEKFRQLDEGTTRRHGGAGLGLAISKELTTLLGGSITVASGAGQGATFTVILPVEAPVEPPEPKQVWTGG